MTAHISLFYVLGDEPDWLAALGRGSGSGSVLEALHARTWAFKFGSHLVPENIPKIADARIIHQQHIR